MAQMLCVKNVVGATNELHRSKTKIISLLKHNDDATGIVTRVAVFTKCMYCTNKSPMERSKYVFRNELCRKKWYGRKCTFSLLRQSCDLRFLGSLERVSETVHFTGELRKATFSRGLCLLDIVAVPILCPRLELLAIQIMQRRAIFTSVTFEKSHYEALGVTPNATQADIKDAYYKLSMRYHPDRNEGSVEAATQFRAINAAYEVLGNYRQRKMYDRGMLHRPDVTEEDVAGETKFYRSRFTRERAPTATGRTQIYNFDEWTRAHYGNTFNRRESAKARWEQEVSFVETDKKEAQTNIALLVILGAFVFLLSFSIKSEDVVSIKEADKETENARSKNSPEP